MFHVQILDPEQDDGLTQKLEHKLVSQLDSERADGWSQLLEQRCQNDRARNKLTSHNIESVGQVVGVQSKLSSSEK